MQREDVDRLMRDGVTLTAPGPELSSAASHVEELGLIRVHRLEYVRCADPEDRDFSRTNRHCQGRIYLDGPLRDIRCPECERRVFPDADHKRRHPEIRVEVLPDGVMDFVTRLIEHGNHQVTPISQGVLRASAGQLGVFVCVVDCCNDARFLARDWASTQPTCYVTVNPRAKERFLNEPWLCRVELAGLICGEADLSGVLEKTATDGPPSAVRVASIPVYSKTVRPVYADQPRRDENRRSFLVELDDDVVWIEGQRVVEGPAATRYQIFRILWERFVEDLGRGRRPDEFQSTDLDAIIRCLKSVTGQALVDEMSVRRAINRLQADIAEMLRRSLGLPIQRDDVVETCRWKGQARAGHGYRLNPRRIAVRSPLCGQ